MRLVKDNGSKKAQKARLLRHCVETMSRGSDNGAKKAQIWQFSRDVNDNVGRYVDNGSKTAQKGPISGDGVNVVYSLNYNGPKKAQNAPISRPLCDNVRPSRFNGPKSAHLPPFSDPLSDNVRRYPYNRRKTAQFAQLSKTLFSRSPRYSQTRPELPRFPQQIRTEALTGLIGLTGLISGLPGLIPGNQVQTPNCQGNSQGGRTPPPPIPAKPTESWRGSGVSQALQAIGKPDTTDHMCSHQKTPLAWLERPASPPMGISCHIPGITRFMARLGGKGGLRKLSTPLPARGGCGKPPSLFRNERFCATKPPIVTRRPGHPPAKDQPIGA